jgi:mRNA interferase MazF
MSAVLARGDVVLTRFPFTDLTGSSVRPALVVSVGMIGQDIILAGISSVVRGSAIATDLIVDVSHPNFQQTGLRVASVIRLHKLVTVESAVLVRKLGKVSAPIQAEVDRILRLVLGL